MLLTLPRFERLHDIKRQERTKVAKHAPTYLWMSTCVCTCGSCLCGHVRDSTLCACEGTYPRTQYAVRAHVLAQRWQYHIHIYIHMHLCVQAILCVPFLRNDGSVIGVMQASNKVPLRIRVRLNQLQGSYT